MSKPDYDLLVSWVVDDVETKFKDMISNVIHARLEHWFTETREALMQRAAQIARDHRCRPGNAISCECSAEIARDITEARLSG